VPAERLRHLLATPLALPADTGELLGEAGLARLPDHLSWMPGHLRLPATIPAMAACLLAALPPDRSPGEAAGLADALARANGVAAAPSIVPFLHDLAGVGGSTRVDRIHEWLLEKWNVPAPEGNGGLSFIERADQREKAMARLLARAESTSQSLNGAAV
jgi:hypothetical protein